MKPVYFKDWVTDWKWGVRIALLLILLSSLVQLGMFALTQNYLVGYLGAQPEDISFALMSTYAGIISILPVQFRFLKYFETRSYLLFNIMAAILLNILCLKCQDINFFCVIRFFQGILVGNINVCVLLMIFSRLAPERVRTVGAAVFYGAIFGNSVVIGLVAGSVVESEDWKVTYYYLVLFQLIMLVITLLMLRPLSHHKRYPLYQIDWAGFVIFALSAVALAYTMIYGSKYYWFSDPRIQYSSLAAGIGSLLFLYRQQIVKRPLIHLGIFKSGNFLVGLGLLIVYYGSKDSINLIYSYVAGPLRWSALQVMALAICNIAGLISLLVIATRLIMTGRNFTQFLFITGFVLMAVFNVWMCFLLTPDLSFWDLALPVFLQGAASGLLFVPIMIYVLSSAPAYTTTTGLVVAACVRYTTTLHSIAGFYNLQLYYNQYFKDGFLSFITLENQNVMDRLNYYQVFYTSKGFSADQASGLARAAIGQSLALQTQLLTSRALFMIFGILMLSVAVLILVIPAVRKTFIHWNKRLVINGEIPEISGK